MIKMKGLLEMTEKEVMESSSRLHACKNAPNGYDVYGEWYCRVENKKQYGCDGCIYNRDDFKTYPGE